MFEIHNLNNIAIIQQLKFKNTLFIVQVFIALWCILQVFMRDGNWYKELNTLILILGGLVAAKCIVHYVSWQNAVSMLMKLYQEQAKQSGPEDNVPFSEDD